MSAAMKKNTVILGLLVICFFGVITLVRAEIPNAKFEKKLNETIKKVDFEDLTIDTAVSFLANTYKINIVLINMHSRGEIFIDLFLQNQSLRRVLHFLCKAGKLHYRLDKNAVVISGTPFPKHTPEKLKQKKLHASTLKQKSLATRQKMALINLPVVEFDAADMHSVVRYLSRISKRNDPQRKGVNIVIGLDSNKIKELPHISLSLRDISLADVIRYICLKQKMQCDYFEGVAVLVPQKQKVVVSEKVKQVK